MAITTIATGIAQGTALCALPDQTVVVADATGVLTRYDPAGSVTDTAALGAAVRGLVARPGGPGGSGVLAAAPKAGLWDVDFATGTARQLRRLPGARGVTVDVFTGAVLVCRKKGGGTLFRVPFAAGPKQPVARNLGAALALGARGGERTGWVLLGGRSARLVEVSLFPRRRRSATTGTTITGIGRARDVAWTGAAGTELAVADRDGRILLVDTADASAAPKILEKGLDPVWAIDLLPAAAGVAPRLVAGIGDTLALVDLPAPPEVTLEMPTAALYLSSWARIGVATSGGRTIDDVVFAVDPPEGGTISVSRDATFEHRPSVVLATSALPGRYRVLALDRVTGDKLAVGEFSISDVWDGPEGPPVSFVGEVGTDSPDPAWGGGDPYVPQNLGVTPALGRKNVAVVIAETNDVAALSAADQATLRTAWQNEVFDGVLRGGVLESARRYWGDVSRGLLDLVNAGVLGPVRLPNNWASYATGVDTTTGQTDGWENFANAVVANIRQQNDAAAAAGNPPVLDLTTVDSIILVLRSLPATGTSPGRFVWPSATRPGGYQLSFEVARQTVTIGFPFGSIDITVPVTRTIQMLAMPTDWEARDSSNRVRGETAAHELGHNLGLPDEYARSSHPQWAKDRDLAASTSTGASWSLMSWEEQFPQTTIVEKMRLGWVDAAHVRNLSFAALGPVDEDITLHASDLGPPPAGRFSAVEVRIADGSNYYFEYRREQPSATSDQDIPADSTVFAVDCRSGDEPSDRRNILRIKNDADNDRAEFQTGDDYREQDTSDPSYPNDFRMEVLGTNADSARIHITYGDSKPDPQIRPWAPSTNWKSPDLEVTNARNQADSRFRDIPWEGHDNRIVATVRNPGQLDAHGVRVNFFVKDFTLASGAETPLGSDVHDVPTNTDVTFTSSVPWVPPPLSAIPFLHIAPHYCVVARIEEYSDPANPAIREITRDNNEAQSNHTQLISVNASPSSREIGLVKVTNPLPDPADCRVQVRQTSEFARTYLEHAWVRLQPGEERDVMFLTESVLGDPLLGSFAAERRERIYKSPNSVRLTGIVDDHRTCEGFVTGGAHVLVRAARATRFVKFSSADGLAQGRVEAVDDGSGADGTVLVSVWPPEAPEKGREARGHAVNGDFRVEVGDVDDGWLVQGHYLGSFDLAPCDSETVR
jgi:hypothetical protein